MDNNDYKNDIDRENIRLKSFKLKSEEILSKLLKKPIKIVILYIKKIRYKS